MNQSKFHLHGVYILVEEVSRKQAIDPQAVMNSTKKDTAKREDRQPGREGGALGKESGKASEESSGLLEDKGISVCWSLEKTQG